MIRPLCQLNHCQQRRRKLIFHCPPRSHFIYKVRLAYIQEGRGRVGYYLARSVRWVGIHSLIPISPSILHFPRLLQPTNLLVG